MGATKNEIYDEKTLMYAKLFKALAHPARLKALLMVVEAEEKQEDLTFSDIKQEIDLAQSTLTVHMNKLVDAGVLKTKTIKKVNKNCLKYKLNTFVIQEFRMHFDIICTHVKDEIKKNGGMLDMSDFKELRQFFNNLRINTC